MKRETFERYKPLELFDCKNYVQEKDGYFSMTDKRGTALHLVLRDTVVNPNCWSGTKIKIEYRGFGDVENLVLCFGKPYANEKAETASVRAEITKGKTGVCESGVCVENDFSMPESGVLYISVSEHEMKVGDAKFELKCELCGYFEMYSERGRLEITSIEVEAAAAPYTLEEHDEALLKWRHRELDKRDSWLDALERYISENPMALPQKKGELTVSPRIADVGDEVVVRAVSFCGRNAALTVTQNSLGENATCEAIPLAWTRDNGVYRAEFKFKAETAGNTRVEFWVGEEKIVRQVAVIGKGCMAVIPWIGENRPYIDEELHRFDIAGDYWMCEPSVCENPRHTIEKFEKFIKNHRKYGDGTACFVNATALLPLSETDSLFELDRESQERGLAQIKRQMELLDYEHMELVASYTPDATSIEIMEKLGVKALTSLCAWQNWQDSGWKINHCGVSNQPYYPANDDFRRSGDERQLMCFTMGNASCNRNYSIMAYDACPTNAVPGERYLENYVVNQNQQRFFDAFDGYIADKDNNPDSLMTVTVAIESFAGRMDWNAANEMAIRYMMKKAAHEKIVFTSAADISDYHRVRKMKMQEAFFFQPDYYYGYHNGTMPGRIDDRIEVDTREYLAVVRRGSGLPMYFYDYTVPWASKQFEKTERNEFGLVDPDEHKPSECVPKQVYTEDVKLGARIDGKCVLISAECESEKKKMVTGVFDIPFEKDFGISTDKADVRVKKIYDKWTGNTHLFVDLGRLPKGKSEVKITLDGAPRKCVSAEDVHDGFAAMWFGDHAYLRSCDKETAIRVEIPAPKGAYIRLISGEKIFESDGKLCFTVNTAWFDEAPMLVNYGRDEFSEALAWASVEKIGATKCSRWSGQ